MPTSSSAAHILLLWVPWRPPSLNRTLGQHWTVSLRHKRAAQRAWQTALASASPSSPSAADFRTPTTPSPA